MGWPIKYRHGEDLIEGSIGSFQVGSNPTTKSASAHIEVWRHARNGKPPDVGLLNKFSEAANQSILYRGKEVFRGLGMVGTGGGSILSSAGAGDRARWRFAFHTSVYTGTLMAVVAMAPQDSGYTTNSACRIDILTGAGAVAGTATFNYGTNPGGTSPSLGIAYMKPSQQYIEGLTPDTDYYGIVYDVDNGRTFACSIFELPSMTENSAGYMPQNLTAESSILDVYRSKLATITYNQWRRAAATVFNWSVDDQGTARTTTSATAVNVIDGSSTTYAAAIPGYTLEMSRKARRSTLSAGVPVRIQAYMACSSASNGVVHLRDSAGTIVGTLTNTLGAGTAGWISTTCSLAVSEAKYYLTFQTAAGTLSLYAVSCYEYE